MLSNNHKTGETKFKNFLSEIMDICNSIKFYWKKYDLESKVRNWISTAEILPHSSSSSSSSSLKLRSSRSSASKSSRSSKSSSSPCSLAYFSLRPFSLAKASWWTSWRVLGRSPSSSSSTTSSPSSSVFVFVDLSSGNWTSC